MVAVSCLESHLVPRGGRGGGTTLGPGRAGGLPADGPDFEDAY